MALLRCVVRFIASIIKYAIVAMIVGCIGIATLYYCCIVVAPLELWYDKLPPAGPSSVYVPGKTML